MEKIAIFFLVIALLSNFACAKHSNQQSKPAEGINYDNIEVEYAIDPNKFKTNDERRMCGGFYDTIKYVATKDSRIMDYVFETINRSDIPRLLGDKNYSEKALTLFVECSGWNGTDYADSPYWNDEMMLPDTVYGLNNGNRVIYIESESFLQCGTKYCFAYDGHIIFTRQWISDFFTDVRKEIKTITEYFELGDSSVIWRFDYKDGRLNSAVVNNFSASTPLIVKYDFLKKQTERIPIYRE